MTERLDDILAADLPADLSTLTIDDVRERRAACKEVETGLSYLRRLVQGRLDVVAAERERRVEGGSGDHLEELIARLPEVLAGGTRSPGTGRLPHSIGPGAVDDDLAAELEEIVAAPHIDEPDQLADEQLATIVEKLSDFEHKVSGLRREMFDRIDALEAELTRRYKSGEASIDGLLR